MAEEIITMYVDELLIQILAGLIIIAIAGAASSFVIMYSCIHKQALDMRLMKKATDPERDGYIERFQFRDLRRKSASDEVDEIVAQQRLGHANVGITNRVYRVKPRKVRPLR